MSQENTIGKQKATAKKATAKKAVAKKAVAKKATTTQKATFTEKKLLTVSRHKTTPGTHPYDQFNWERRDVVMKNWRDGSINFEQLGVEFPSNWSENATSIVTSKYFRGKMGAPEREWSLKQVIDRVVDTYAKAAVEYGYMNEENASIFSDELKYALVDQQFAFNSPVWFNVGTKAPQQISACFILAVEDSMASILNWYVEEGLVFKGGSGAGVNLSNIRSSREHIGGGGHPSGPVSFMRGADASAGTIKSGGASRRAAKMVVLDVDHPDILEFVQTKSLEENKIRALRDAGFDMDMGGKDINSVQFQNANNSVRVNDEFMKAVISNGKWDLTSRTSGEVIETVNAADLWNEIAKAAWECADPGMQYDDAIQDWHTLPNSGRITASNPCSEYMSLDNSSCNLASIRLTKFFNPTTGQFDVKGFSYLTSLITTAMDISISFADFPTKKIGEVTRDIRTLGLGFTDLGAMLMSAGAGYDSELGRLWAASITALMSGVAYEASSKIAQVVGSFEYFDKNKAPMVRVLGKHSDAVAGTRKTLDALDTFEISLTGNVNELLDVAQDAWSDAYSGAAAGYMRNAQISVVAPTGTISFFLDADTTGIEPDLGLVKYKKLSSGGSLQIVNQMVPVALKRLGYAPDEIKAITEHILETGQVLAAPGFNPVHSNVFATAMGTNVISPEGHIRMMAAVQPFISGAQSKTINLPFDATVEEVAKVYLDSWKLGLKAVAIYRDGCKVGQPMTVKGAASAAVEEGGDASTRSHPRRVRLPRTRNAKTTSFSVAGAEGYITVGTYEDGAPGEVFISMSKQGSTLSGVMDALAISISVGLQHGVPIETLISKFINSRFEPSGMTDDEDIRIASSILDYIARRLALDYLDSEQREVFGVKSTAERTADLDSGSYGDAPALSSPTLEAKVTLKLAPARQERGLVADDTPLCMTCGNKMRRAGSCFVCESCGNTTGCS